MASQRHAARRCRGLRLDGGRRPVVRPLPSQPAPGPNGAPLLRSALYHHDDLGNLTDTWIDGLLDEVHEIDPVRPHRLAGIHFLHGAGLRTYLHDARGRLESDSSGRQIQSTPFDLPRHVGHAAGEAHFAYDAFGARIKKTSWTGGEQTTTITLGGLYERREHSGGGGGNGGGGGSPTVEHVYYVHGDGGPVAQVTYHESTGKETTTYLAHDGLGSIGVVFGQSGTTLERLFHEPFGQRTDLDGGPLKSFTSPSGLAIGFTGQRHDDDLDLIDYRGRAYDPVQKRFLTADPFVVPT